MKADPLTKIASLISLILVMNLSQMCASPVNMDALDNMKLETWMHSCGYHSSFEHENKNRHHLHYHIVHQILKAVRTQLKLVRSYIRTQASLPPHLMKVYKELKGYYRLDWLPKVQHYTNISCFNESSKAETVLPDFYEGLQKFVLTFDKLRAFTLKSEIKSEHDMSTRNENMRGINNELIRLLCEVASAITSLNIPAAKLFNDNLVMYQSEWIQEGDMTMMMIQDAGIIKQLQIFLKNWGKIMRNVTKPLHRTCNTHFFPPNIKQHNRRKLPKIHKKKNRRQDPMKKRTRRF